MSDVCLVTGAGGFIGSRLCAALSQRTRVRALLRGDAEGAWHESVRADITEGVPPSATDGVDTVFHLAAYTHAGDDDEVRYRRVNVDGTRALLEAAKASGVRRVVFVSSVKAVGEGGERVIDDATEPHPTTAYGRTKREAETMVLSGGYVPEAVVLRPALVYGPGVKGNLEAMMRAIDAGRFPPPPRVENRRSLVHVDDVAAAAVAAGDADAAVGRAFIVTDGRAYSTRSMYEAMCRSLGREVPSGAVPAALLRVLAVVGDGLEAVTRRRWPFDSDACRKLLGSAWYDGSGFRSAVGFEPRWTLESALPAMAAALRRQ